jgi:hypothetical protein
MPAPQFIVEHSAKFTQQMAAPTDPAVVPSLVGSLYLPVPQVTPVCLHLEESFSQQVVLSEAAHVPAAQYKLAAAAFNLSAVTQMPPPVEHFALFAQHCVTGTLGLTAFLAVSLNLVEPQLTVVLMHCVLSVSQ